MYRFTVSLRILLCLVGSALSITAFAQSSSDGNVSSNYVPMQGHENLTFSPTAFTLPKGTFEYRNIMFLGNGLDYALTDELTLGGGMVAHAQFMLKGKFASPITDKIRAGIGSNLFIQNPVTNELGGMTGYLHGILTIGTPDRFVNFAAGPRFLESLEFLAPRVTYTFSAGGAWRIGDRWRVMTDLIYYTGNGGEFHPFIALSWFNRRHRIDFGVLQLGEYDRFIPFPYLSYAFRFGKS